MKIQPQIGNVIQLERSRKYGDATEKDQGNAGYQPEEKNRSSEDDPEPTYREVSQAVDSFGEDPSLHALGVEAEVEGVGPGLRVTLKDGKGAWVRQFTGQEFLEMREAAQATGRGKILDRKV